MQSDAPDYRAFANPSHQSATCFNSSDSADDWHCIATVLLSRPRRLTVWEQDWLNRLRQQDIITDGQRAVLTTIVRAASDGPELPKNTLPAVVEGVPGLVRLSGVLPNGRSSTPRFISAHDLSKPIRQMVVETLTPGSDR